MTNMTSASSASAPSKTDVVRDVCAMTPEQIAHFDSSDPGIGLFHTCLLAGAPMTITPGMRVLEVGCNESDWLIRASAAFLETDFVGLDWRAPEGSHGRVTTVRGNGLDPDLFAPASFDAVVSLSAIEHFGLGHYSQDPIDPEGDTRIVQNVWRWLTPGGWFYFDVPYDPAAYRVCGTECRVYNEPAVYGRLRPREKGYSVPFAAFVHAKQVKQIVEWPRDSVPPFYYMAQVLRKA